MLSSLLEFIEDQIQFRFLSISKKWTGKLLRVAMIEVDWNQNFEVPVR